MSDPYALNPLLTKEERERPALVAMARRDGPPPTLFHSGDLPLMLASGQSPSTLLRLPWQARHQAAGADQATLAKMLEDYAGPDADLAAEMELGGHPGNLEYKSRMNAWLSGFTTRG